MIKEIRELQRQIELAAIVLEHPGFYSEYELADKFKTSPTTLRRDLSALRSLGADIHSRKGKIIAYFSLKNLNTLISTYYSLNSTIEIRNLRALSNKFKTRTLSIFVEILKAIRDRREIQIEYKSVNQDCTVTKVISPIYLIGEIKTFYIVAYDRGEERFFRLELINKVKPLKTKQSNSVPPLSEIFRNTWGVFTGGEEAEVKLKFKREMDSYITDKFWMENQDIEYVKDGIILKMKVKLSYEFISWVMGWGDEVEILEPLKLKEEIVNKAKGIIEKYE